MKVWTVESGDYSDYSVDGIYSSRENAELAVEKLFDNNMYLKIVERELDPFVKELREGFQRFYVRMRYDGDTEEVCREFSFDDTGDADLPSTFNGRIVLYVTAKDEKHAVKIANEKRIQLIASGELHP